jgi:hypothetical protein
LVLSFMGLNRSNEPSAQELDLNPDDAQRMTVQLREGSVRRQPAVMLSGEVEGDEGEGNDCQRAPVRHDYAPSGVTSSLMAAGSALMPPYLVVG